MSRDPLPTGRFFMVRALTQSGRAGAQSEERKTGEVYKTGGRSDPLDRHKYTDTHRVKNPRLEQWRPQTRQALALLIKRL